MTVPAQRNTDSECISGSALWPVAALGLSRTATGYRRSPGSDAPLSL